MSQYVTGQNLVVHVNGDFSTEESRMAKPAAEKTEVFEKPQNDEQDYDDVNDLLYRPVHGDERNQVEKHTDNNQCHKQSNDGHAVVEAKDKP